MRVPKTLDGNLIVLTYQHQGGWTVLAENPAGYYLVGLWWPRLDDTAEWLLLTTNPHTAVAEFADRAAHERQIRGAL